MFGFYIVLAFVVGFVACPFVAYLSFAFWLQWCDRKRRRERRKLERSWR